MAAAVVALVALGIVGAVIARRHSPPEPEASVPLSAVVRQIEHVLGDSATSRRSADEVLALGFACRIRRSDARGRMQDVIDGRTRDLARVRSMTAPPAAATRAVALLDSALDASIRADIAYRNGFRYARGCPPTSDYFAAAGRADLAATAAKARFVTAFNPLAMTVGARTWEASAL